MYNFNYIYCVCTAWSYDEYDIIFCSYLKNNCVNFINKHRELKKYNPTIHKVILDKTYFYGIQHGRTIKYE